MINNKGGYKLSSNGYTYYLDNEKDYVYKWRCSDRKKFVCKAKMTTMINEDLDHEIIDNNNNSHSNDLVASHLEVRYSTNNLKNKAKTSS